MLYYFQNFKKICDKIIQFIKEPISALKLLNYKYRITKLKIRRITPFIDLPGLLNLDCNYTLARPVNNLINLA